MKAIHHSFLKGFNWLLAGVLCLFGFSDCTTSKKSSGSQTKPEIQKVPRGMFTIAYGPRPATYNDTVAKTAPLLIVDGKEVTNEQFQEVNIEDIESFSVLDDASAVEKYGEKGRNGVIIITLKKKDQ